MSEPTGLREPAGVGDLSGEDDAATGMEQEVVDDEPAVPPTGEGTGTLG